LSVLTYKIPPAVCLHPSPFAVVGSALLQGIDIIQETETVSGRRTTCLWHCAAQCVWLFCQPSAFVFLLVMKAFHLVKTIGCAPGLGNGFENLGF